MQENGSAEMALPFVHPGVACRAFRIWSSTLSHRMFAR